MPKRFGSHRLYGRLISNLSGGDPDTKAYFAAAGITDATEKAAVEDLVAGLKSNNLWGKMDRIYPISPTSLAAAAYCLKTRTTITWVNTPTHASTGVTFDGSTQYGNTNYSASDLKNYQANSAHLSFYVGNDFAVSGNKVWAGAALTHRITLNSSGDLVVSLCKNSIASESGPIDERGLNTASRTSQDLLTVYENSSSVSSDTNNNPTSVADVDNWFLGARNNSGSPLQFTDMDLRFASFGGGLSSSEVTSLFNLVEAYQDALSRGVVT